MVAAMFGETKAGGMFSLLPSRGEDEAREKVGWMFWEA